MVTSRRHGDAMYLALSRSTGGSLTVIEATIDGGPPRHTHGREDESFSVLTGTLDVECGEDRLRAGSGSFVFLPRDLPHVFRSVGGPATALLIVPPGGLDEYFKVGAGGVLQAPASRSGWRAADGQQSPVGESG